MSENLGEETGSVQRGMLRLARACETREKWAILALSFMLIFLGAQTGVTEQIVPANTNLVNYQGMLYLASDGTTPVTGYQNLEFRLYATANSDTPVWAELHQDVQVANGEFGVYLGAGEEIEGEPYELLQETFKTAPLWLGVTVGLDAELPARQLITSVPYALRATSATTATHGVPPGTIVMFAGTEDTIPSGWLLCNGDPYDRDGQYEALFIAIGTTWDDDPGPGTDKFQVPNFRGCTPIGQVAPLVVNDYLGESAVTLGLTEIPSHSHDYLDRQIDYRYTTKYASGAYFGANDPVPADPRPETFENTPADDPHNNVQPSTYLYFIIKL
jgi:microcystin-dependent protein